ncbi:MAG: aspartate aminotransferase family protein [Methylorubrum populi]
MSSARSILSMNRFAGVTVDGQDRALAERLRQREATFGASSVLFYEQPLEVVRAEGVYLFDVDGRRYLDVYNNVPSVGHCHPKVVEAISRQVAKLNIHTRYLVRPVADYAERLLATFPAPLTNLVMTCTGSESNDLALRIAETATGAKGFIVTQAAYHGNTSAVTEISPSLLRTRAPHAHVRTIPAPAATAGGNDVAAAFSGALMTAIASLKASGYGFAGLIVDTIFSSDGVHADPPGFLGQAADVTRQAGGLFIADEVQPGFGRTGAGLWGFARHGIVPDIVTLGKPMGNGFPMAGMVTRPELLAAFCDETGYFNTFGGNPVAAAAGLAVLDVIEEERLIANAATVGALLKERLSSLVHMSDRVGAVRGAGLFLGLDLVDPEDGAPDARMASLVINNLRSHGILMGIAGLHGNTLKIRPPLCLSVEHVDHLMSALISIINSK